MMIEAICINNLSYLQVYLNRTPLVGEKWLAKNWTTTWSVLLRYSIKFDFTSPHKVATFALSSMIDNESIHSYAGIFFRLV